MFKNLCKGILATIAVKVLDNYRQLSIQLLKIEATKAYVHGVKAARLSVLGLMWMGLVIGLVCIGTILFHIGLFILLPWSMEAKAGLGMVLGLVYMVGGGLMLRVGMAEKRWMEKSGAGKMLNEVVGGTRGE